MFLNVATAVLLYGLLIRALLLRGTQPKVLASLVVAGLGLWRGSGSGPGWLFWPAVALLVLMLFGLLSTVVAGVRMPRADMAEVKARLLAECRAEDAPQQLTLAVAPAGGLMMDRVRNGRAGREAVLPGRGCPVCVVEEVTAELAGPDAPALAEYRRDRDAGTNRLVVLERGEYGWMAELQPVRASSKPFRTVGCPVHG